MDTRSHKAPNGHANGLQNESSHRRKKPFLIGVAGGTASGKTTVCNKIMEELGETMVDSNERRVVIISQDSFYKNLTPDQKALALKGLFNFDHPDAFDVELMYKTLLDIVNQKMVEIPVYDFVTHSRRENETITVHPADVVLLEGILIFFHKYIRDMLQIKLFVDTDSDTRLSRRVLRDIEERGRDLSSVLQQYTKFVKPAFEEFCHPTKKYADVIIPRGAENKVAICLIVQHIKEILHTNYISAATTPAVVAVRHHNGSGDSKITTIH